MSDVTRDPLKETWDIETDEDECGECHHRLSADDDPHMDHYEFAVFYVFEREDDKLQKQRATLASAAPDLYRALEAMTAQESWEDGYDAAMDLAVKALAKARGE